MFEQVNHFMRHYIPWKSINNFNFIFRGRKFKSRRKTIPTCLLSQAKTSPPPIREQNVFELWWFMFICATKRSLRVIAFFPFLSCCGNSRRFRETRCSDTRICVWLSSKRKEIFNGLRRTFSSWKERERKQKEFMSRLKGKSLMNSFLMRNESNKRRRKS